MNESNHIRTNWHLFALLMLYVGGLHADPVRAKRIATKRQQQELARLLKDYRHVKTVELKAGFVEEAIKRGRPFTDGLKRQIELDGQRALRTYPPLSFF